MRSLYMFKKAAALLGGLSMLASLGACADDLKVEGVQAEASGEAKVKVGRLNVLAPSVPADILNKIKRVRPDIPFDNVEPTEVPGLYAAEMGPGQMMYLTESGDHFIIGDIYEINTGGIVNLTEKAKGGERAAQLATLKPEDMISFAPNAETKAEIYVFTDVDCGYCRKLHREISQLNGLGIKVNYLAWPRSGFGSETYKRMLSAWCADDRAKAMDTLKNGGNIEIKSCDDSIIKAQFEMGRAMGVNGTPAIVFKDGTMVPGYKPANVLGEMLGLN